MTTIWNQHMLAKLADGSLNLANQNIGLMLLYSYAVPTGTSPDNATVLVTQPGFQELDAGTGYNRAGQIVPCNTSVTGGITSVIIGANWALTLNKEAFVAAGVFYVPGSIAGLTDPWLFISDDMFGNVVTPGAVVGTSASPKTLFSYTVRGGTPGPSPILYEAFNALTAWTVTVATVVAGGRTGNAVQITGTNSIAYTIPAPSESDTVIVGFGYRVDTIAAQKHPLILRSDAGATNHTTIRVNTDGSLAVLRGGITGAIIATSAAGLITANTWAYIELSAKLSDTVGAVTLRLNGTVVASASGVDTKNVGTKTTYDNVQLLSTTGSTGLWDDLYVMTGSTVTFLGPQSITGPYTPPATGGTVDISMGTIVQSPGPTTWESARIQHVYLYPQRVNFIPNPSFEDVGLFGWRSDGTLTRVVGGVDNPNNYFGRTTGKIFESVAIPSQGPSRFSAFVRSTSVNATTAVLKYMCLDETYAVVTTRTSKMFPLTRNQWVRLDAILIPADDTTAFIPRIEATQAGLDADLVLLTPGEGLHDYFDGDSATGLPGDFAWQGNEAQSYSTYYNNRYNTAARLFGEYKDGQVSKPALIQTWVPTGTSVFTHWDVLNVNDTKHPLKDWSSRTFVP